MSIQSTTAMKQDNRGRDLFLWLIPILILLAVDAWQWRLHPVLPSGDLPDPDTGMRLAYLQQVDGTGNWAQGFFIRNNAPYGMVLHWTQPFNFLLLAFVHILRDANVANPWRIASVFTGPLLRLLTVPVAYWAVRAITSPPIACAASAAIVLSPYIANYAMFGTANYHALLYGESIVLIGLFLRLIQKPKSRNLAYSFGSFAGFSLWSGFELGAVLLPLFGYLVWIWIVKADISRTSALRCSSLALLIMTALAWWIDPPYGGHFVIAFDHLSLPFVAIAAAGALFPLIAGAFPLFTPQRRTVFTVQYGLVSAIAWVGAFPEIRFGVLGPNSTEKFGSLKLPLENLPLATPQEFTFLLGPILLAIATGIIFYKKIPHAFAITLALIVFGVLGLRYYRLVCYAVIAATIMIAYCLELFCRKYPNLISIILFALTAGVILMDAEADKFPVHIFPGKTPIDCRTSTVRSTLYNAEWLKSTDPEPIFINELPITPPLLFSTTFRTVAGGYHRDVQGLTDYFTFFQSQSGTPARRVAAERGISFILLCESKPYAVLQHFEADNWSYDEAPEDTFYNRLVHRQYPDWLKLRPWPEGTKTGLLLYQVDPDRLKDTP